MRSFIIAFGCVPKFRILIIIVIFTLNYIFTMNSFTKMMLEYSFEREDLARDVDCSMCQRLLTNAHQAPCGCLFCFDCIENYLNNQTKYCPGKTEACAKTELSLLKNLRKDDDATKRVADLETKCPLTKCNYHGKLDNMWNHLRVCAERKNFCPYRDMGCHSEMMNEEGIVDHLQDQVYAHTQILIELVMNLKNENKVLASMIPLSTEGNLEQMVDKKICSILQKNNDDNSGKQVRFLLVGFYSMFFLLRIGSTN